MIKRHTQLFLLTFFLFFPLYCTELSRPESITVLAPKEVKKETGKEKKDTPYKKVPTPLVTKSGQKIWFKFKEEPLIDIINYVASSMGINVVLPQGQDVLTTKVTYEYPNKIPVTEAYEKVLSILKITGYLFVPQGDFYYIIKNDKDVNKQTYPLYINTLPTDLPDLDIMIRYVYYFANIQVPSSGGSAFGDLGGGSSGNALLTFLKDVLSAKTFNYLVDPSTNGIIMTDYARNIRSVMEIVREVDSHGFTDSIEIIPLKHTNASTIAALFMNQLINASSNSSSGGAFGGGSGGQAVASQATPSSSTYFTNTTKIVAEPRSNSLIAIGKKDAITRIKEFVKKYIDVPLDEGDSILHVYPLQYLNATNFAPILTQIVTSQASSSSIGGGAFGGTTSQSSGGSSSSTGKQFFKGVIIQPEIISTTQATSSSLPNASTVTAASTIAAPQAAQQGGNRLLIAALRDDWTHLKRLIFDLDRPQPQVAIEMLIVDFTLSGNRTLGSQVRNKQGMFPVGVNAQTSTLGPIVLTNNSSFDALMANLLQVDTNGDNLATSLSQGSFVLSLQDNVNTGIAWVLQALTSYTNTKILSHPFSVTLNNQPTQFQDTETRLLPGSATVKKGATFTPIDPVSASLNLAITPSINGEDYINLGINITIDEFSTGNSRITRAIQTNANIKDGQVLILGGLTKTTAGNTDQGTPGLEKIPVIGWLFKKKSKSVIKSNLAIFICPRILQSTNGYCDSFTAGKFSIANQAVDTEKNFSSLRDPITRWFFDKTHEITNQQKVSNFINRKQFSDQTDYTPSAVLSEQENQPKLLLPTPKRVIAQKAPQPSLKIAQAIPTPKKLPKKTIILSKKDTPEQEELKQLFSSFSQTTSMHDLATQKKANLL